jgi:hypothetical protein
VPDLPLRLTAIVLLLRPPEIWWLAVSSTLVAGLALLFRKVRHASLTWAALGSIVVVRIIDAWPLADNHIYLLAYWCLAIAFALKTASAAVTLRVSSRWLLGAAFTFAVLWKAGLSPDYLDGRFFRVTLLTDDRFADTLMLVGGVTADELLQNRQILVPIPEGAELSEPHTLIEPPRVRALAMVATWGALLMEASVAVLCLVPARRLQLARHASILTFCVLTYALAPVAGFGWLIATMGLAKCHPDQRALARAYVAVFFVVMAFSELPRSSFEGVV